MSVRCELEFLVDHPGGAQVAGSYVSLPRVPCVGEIVVLDPDTGAATCRAFRIVEVALLHGRADGKVQAWLVGERTTLIPVRP